MLRLLAQDRTFTLTTLRGVPVWLQTSSLLLPAWAALCGYIGPDGGTRGASFMLLFVLLTYLCAGLHELGHIVPACLFGATITRVRLSGLGAFVQVETHAPTTPAQELFISVGGPLGTALLTAVLLVFAWPIAATQGLALAMRRDPQSLIVGLAVMNALLMIFNLLPVRPMDGARIRAAIRALRLARLGLPGLTSPLASLPLAPDELHRPG